MLVKRISLLNVNIDNVTMGQAVDCIDMLVQKKKPSYIVTPNLDHIVKLEKDKEFKRVYEHADLVLADGKPLIWISKWNKRPIIEKVSGSDLFPKVCERAAQKGYKLYILGGATGVPEKAADNLRLQYPGLMIVGTASPPKGFEKNAKEIKQIIRGIREAKPDILAVCFGSPKSEKFIFHYLDKMNVPVSMSIGATVDFIAGNMKRAPKWMSRCGLEWFYRMCQEPKRLVRRYFIDAVMIIPLMLKYRKR